MMFNTSLWHVDAVGSVLPIFTTKRIIITTRRITSGDELKSRGGLSERAIRSA